MDGDRFQFQNPSLLGTVVDLTVDTDGRETAERAAEVFFDEVERLQSVFSVFDPESELCRWRSGRLVDQPVSATFLRLMAETLRWQQLTDGLFNPMVGLLIDRWASSTRTPDQAELKQLAAEVAVPRFEMVAGCPVAVGDCTHLNLNAIAKGFIVDEAINRVQQTSPVEAVIVNAGGDIGHRGPEPIRVGIEDPNLPFDNEPPMVVIEIQNESVATSGGGRRRLEAPDLADSHQLNHLIDPRSGQPSDATAGITVVARSAMVADVVATALSLLAPADGLALAERLTEVEPLAALIVDQRQEHHPSTGWINRFG